MLVLCIVLLLLVLSVSILFDQCLTERWYEGAARKSSLVLLGVSAVALVLQLLVVAKGFR